MLLLILEPYRGEITRAACCDHVTHIYAYVTAGSAFVQLQYFMCHGNGWYVLSLGAFYIYHNRRIFVISREFRSTL